MKHGLIKAVLALLTLLGLSSCSMSTLYLSGDKEILLTRSDATAAIKAAGLKSTLVNAYPVSIHQEVLRSEEGNLLVYETTDIDDLYVYTYATARTLALLFDAKDNLTLYTSNNLHFFQLTLQNDTAINIVVHQSGDESLDFVYGFSHKQFETLIQQLKKSAEPLSAAAKKDVVLLNDPQTAIKSNWSDETLFFAPLVSPSHHRMMP